MRKRKKKNPKERGQSRTIERGKLTLSNTPKAHSSSINTKKKTKITGGKNFNLIGERERERRIEHLRFVYGGERNKRVEAWFTLQT